jgi:hypothetical protein|tara:strand:- start:1689 stop:1820 length:132 start_codon:yes stop_codon:yes gene_type:complete
MTKHEELIEWLKTCPVDYYRHGTIKLAHIPSQIIVTFDVNQDD